MSAETFEDVFSVQDDHCAPIEPEGRSVEDLSLRYLPSCDKSITPFVGQSFPSIIEGLNFYKSYAVACGFDVRLGPSRKASDGKCLLFRYVYCSREGAKNSAPEEIIDGSDDSKQKKRRRVSMRTGCLARICLRFRGPNSYIISSLIPHHNHSFVSDASKMFQKLNRKIDFVHQKFVLDCARPSIGPLKSFRLFKEFVGSYPAVGCCVIDFKNISRDLKAFVDGADAQMVINQLCRIKQSCPAYSFDYEVDGEDKLKTLFWCDPICKRNFQLFGDVVSFDATYSTNRYNLIFAPFTGKDNHGKCITFGAGLLKHEDAESYAWLFEKFKNCLGVSPRMIVTDQDLGMKAAIERVFVGTRHRFCMWHIMLKVADKVPSDLKKDEEFKKKLCAVVWSEDIEPADFEVRWTDIMIEYGLIEHKWFDTMFSLRHFWIPAYFRDVPMSGLIKTTSISESENSFFSKYTTARSNLVEFFMNYNSAIDSQRYGNANMNYLDEISKHGLKTSISFEKQASNIYTSTIFRDVQNEINVACFDCSIISIGHSGLHREYIIGDDSHSTFSVVHNVNENTITCSCKKYIRFGLLCRHIYFYMKNLKFDSIPEKYICGRWTKNVRLKHVHLFE